ADVFALGVLLWEAIAGRRLFHGENETETLARVLMCDVPLLESVAPDAPPALCAIAKRALAYDASARFGSAREMQEALEAALRDAGVDVGRARSPRRSRICCPTACASTNDGSRSRSPTTGRCPSGRWRERWSRRGWRRGRRG